MRVILLFTLLICAQLNGALACCGESNHQLLPIGELNDEVVFIEFLLNRNCEMGEGDGEENTFIIYGVINLVKSAGLETKLIENIDSVKVTECQCTYENYYDKTTFEAVMNDYYLKGLALAKSKAGFKLATPTTILFNDTTNVTIEEVVTDSSYDYFFRYGELLDLNLAELPIISCYPDKVGIRRTYVTKQFTITVVQLRCRIIDEAHKAYIRKRFSSIETAFWKTDAQWHGTAKDYFIITPN